MAEKKVHILYTRIPEEIPEEIYKKSLIFLPEVLRDQHFRYRQWKDRAANLFSKILLIAGLRNYGLDHTALEELKYTQYGRPHLSGSLDFNISHSGDFILCAIGEKIKIGVDIEEIKPVDFGDFESLMTVEQWTAIKSAADPIKAFFKFWAIKESIIKADGRGLSVPLNEIIITEQAAFYENNWYLKELDLDDNYCASLASSLENPTIQLEFIDISSF